MYVVIEGFQLIFFSDSLPFFCGGWFTARFGLDYNRFEGRHWWLFWGNCKDISLWLATQHNNTTINTEPNNTYSVPRGPKI